MTQILAPLMLAATMMPGPAPQYPPADTVQPCVGQERPLAANQHQTVRWVTDPQALNAMPIRVLRTVRLSLRDVAVDRVTGAGFYVRLSVPSCSLLVIPAEGSLIHVARDELVDIQGEFRDSRSRSPVNAEGVFIYAYTVRKAPTLVP
jgi:hypothetical protein